MCMCVYDRVPDFIFLTSYFKSITIFSQKEMEFNAYITSTLSFFKPKEEKIRER